MVCERKSNGDLTQRHGTCTIQGSYNYSPHLSHSMSDDKPFACRVPGCNQKFVNEDHLEVHRKKHDISLGIINLKSLDTPVIADQTPTPTRFLKSLAGEDGLFTDLAPNPFDAEFSKASSKFSNVGESTDRPDSSAISSLITVTSDDTDVGASLSSEEVVVTDDGKDVIVHTAIREPRIVTDINDKVEEEVVGMAAVVEAPAQQQQQSRPTVVLVQQPQPTASQTIQIQNLSDQLALSGIPLTGPIMIKLPSGQTIPVVPPSVTNPQMPIPIAVSANPSKDQAGSKGGQDGKGSHNNSVKMKLKNTLLSNQSQGNMNVMAQAVDVVTKQQQEVTAHNHTNESVEEKLGLKRQRSGEEDSETKRQKFLERNRAAAMRCRTKRKQWVIDLEKRAEDLNANNNVLNNEVTKLRNEVAQLKELLLAHKDCPVTIQQREAGLFMRVGELPSRQDNDDAANVITITTNNPS